MITKILEWTLAIFFGALIALPLAAGLLFAIYVLVLAVSGGNASCQETLC